jgi:predicted metal-dependent enzyme (double-stranded beta helix superfamily)
MNAEELVEKIRQAAEQPEPQTAVRDLLRQIIANPAILDSLALPDGTDEIMYYEDAGLSIWNCRFQPHVVIPPHEHTMPVEIGNYAGSEKNFLFKRLDGDLRFEKSTVVKNGETLSLGADAIHAVVADGDTCSMAIHVYFGPLSQVQRGLFDWNDGTKLEFSDENFAKLTRSIADLPMLQ